MADRLLGLLILATVAVCVLAFVTADMLQMAELLT